MAPDQSGFGVTQFPKLLIWGQTSCAGEDSLNLYFMVEVAEV